MREIQRTIVAGIIFSKDGKMLMGRKDPAKGGVYTDAWHIPGGGVEEGETFEQTLQREMQEEVGIDVSRHKIMHVPVVNTGSSEKTLETGERVVANMHFNYFEVHIDQNADEIKLEPGDDLIDMKWFSPEELANVQQIPGGKEFFQQMGYIK